jgi:hypothetical protein
MISDVKYTPRRKFRDLSVAELSSRSVPPMYSAGRAAFIMIHTWTRIRLNHWGDRAEMETSIELLEVMQGEVPTTRDKGLSSIGSES